MSAFLEKYGRWALVTGAAMGLGAEFARQLARTGLNLALSEALWQEWRSSNVDVLKAIVGAADTPGWRAEIPDDAPALAQVSSGNGGKGDG